MCEPPNPAAFRREVFGEVLLLEELWKIAGNRNLPPLGPLLSAENCKITRIFLQKYGGTACKSGEIGI